MKVKIKYEEKVVRKNEVIFEVKSKEEGEKIVDSLGRLSKDWYYSDEIMYTLQELGIEESKKFEKEETVDYIIEKVKFGG